MTLPAWVWWTAYALVGLNLLFQIKRVRRGAEVQLPSFHQLLGVTACGTGARLMILTAIIFFAAMGVLPHTTLY